ncbi:PKD domain-containing protein [Zobellia sp. B3R18]|uniref:PKD domain-containing protein n=1 Tax=Zobellia sp. B3R18 TaxID=2841568 RepID=UPI001C06CE9F|nr:PKD domain-containing protein [Zobellia sp. B3R18]MBU2974657.1 PKD domain-containing protein [Zobellia sp. B3R18]
MNYTPKRTLSYFLYFLGITFLLNLACSKDVETLREAVISKDISPVVDQGTPSGSQQDSLEIEVEEPQVKDSVTVETEIRTFVFYPINDAYLQNGKGYNEPIVRLEEERRTSYLMFDFSPIDSIGGTINAATLMFTINTDDGNGEVDVYKGESSNWTETDLSEKSAPETGELLGVAKQEYRIGTEVSIDLEVGELQLEPATFILDHKDGDDLAFASKEHESQAGSSLIVEYEVPIGADDIALFVTSPKENDDETQNPNNIEEDNTTVEEAPKEVPAEEEEDSSEQNDPTTEEEEEVDVEEETPQEVPADASENDPDQDTTTDNKGEDDTDSNIDALPNTPFPKNEPPVAIANGSPVNGQAPLKVSFSGIDSSDDKAIVSYKWNFEDGQTGNTAEIEHTFDKAGSYEVTLVTKDEEGISASDVVMITVEESKGNRAPVAKLSASKTSGTLPLAVKFTGSGSTDDTGVTAYSWDFKDGNSSDKSDPSHTFESAGSYEVELTVTDAGGLKNKETVSITVESKENGAPVAKPSASKTSGTLPLTVNFTGSGSTDDTGVTAYSWDFKNGNSSDKSDPSHTFESAGSYEVVLTVTDAEGLKDTKTVSIRVDAPANQPPIAKVRASTQSGQAPLTINFTGSGSTDDIGVTAYMWDFKDGSTSNKSNPSHTFDSAGTYEVELTVADVDGLQNKETITVNVQEPVNNPPVAVAHANTLSGEAPLAVSFTGSDSSDDKGVTRYDWNISGNYSNEVNPSHVFTAPGFYDVSLTVTDEEGLTSTSSLSVDVTQPKVEGPIDCSVGGKTAGETGEKVWCWGDISFPSWSGSSGVSFSNKQLYIDSQCDEQQVTKSGNRLKFKVNPKSPNTGSWCSEDYNIRAEIRTEPWNVRHPKGTEEWFGWSYTFGNSYVIDKNNEWLFFQVHPGVSGKSPHTELMVNREGQYGGQAGEIYVINHVNYPDYVATGIVPKAGETIDIVVHAIWGDSSNGLLQVWINGQKFYDQRTKTIYDSHPWGGNAKWGIYKWPWRDGNKVQESVQQGASEIETYLGTIRMITRRPGDSEYGTDSYSQVAPN